MSKENGGCLSDRAKARMEELGRRNEAVRDGRWPHRNKCVNVECPKWTEEDCTCDGSPGCCGWRLPAADAAGLL